MTDKMSAGKYVGGQLAAAYADGFKAGLEAAAQVADNHTKETTTFALKYHKRAEYSTESEMMTRCNESTSIAAAIRTMKHKEAE